MIETQILKPNKYSLEQEREKFIPLMCDFIDKFDFTKESITGRPSADINDILKCLLMMSYTSTSYRRSRSDINKMLEEGMIKTIPSRSVLNKYSNSEKIKKILENLIQTSALFFLDTDSTLILDSTWLATKMYGGGYRQVYNRETDNMKKTRKLHIACFKESKIIAYAVTTEGTSNDVLHFSNMINITHKNGFNIKRVIADAGYCSKENYAICYDIGINDVYPKFRSNSTLKRPKSFIWKEKLDLYRNHPDVWREAYKYRAIVEGIFSAIKRKNLNYLRSKKIAARDCELLLKALVYNLTIIAKHF